MKAGPLNRQVTFLSRPTTARDGYNARTDPDTSLWTPVQTVWASIQPLKGDLLALAQAKTIISVTSVQITTRYNPNLRQDHRIMIGGQVTIPGQPVTYAGMSLDDLSTLALDPPIPDTVTPGPRYLSIVYGPIDPDFEHVTMQFICADVGTP